MELFAYIDPGTGSLFIQTLIGGALAILVVLRGYIRGFYQKIKNAISRNGANGQD